jgi:hypothetical protein
MTTSTRLSSLLTLLFLSFHIGVFSQSFEILDVEIIQRGDSISMLYPESDSLAGNSIQVLPVNKKVQADMTIYIVLNKSLSNYTVDVEVSEESELLYSNSFSESQSTIRPSADASGRGEFLYSYHLGTLRLRQGRRTLQIKIKDVSGNVLSTKSKLF